MTKKQLLALICLVLAALGTVFVALTAMSAAVPEGSPTVQTSTAAEAPALDAGVELPIINLDGNWSAEVKGAHFNATVTGGLITITFVKNDTSLIYWHGSLEPAQSVNDTITSNKVEINKMVLSGAGSKEFVVSMTTLSFTFEAMGSSITVEMSRV